MDVNVIYGFLTLENAREVLSMHYPESFHVNGYLTCTGCRTKRGEVTPWNLEHLMAELQKVVQSGEKPRATRRNEWAAPASSGSALGQNINGKK